MHFPVLAISAPPNDNQTDEIGGQTDGNDEHTVDTNESHDQCAAVQTRAMIAKEGKPPKPLHVKSNPGVNVSQTNS